MTTKHTLTDGHQKMIFEVVPRDGRKVLCDDGGENLMKITLTGMIIGTQSYPGEVKFQSITEARETWVLWKSRGMEVAA